MPASGTNLRPSKTAELAAAVRALHLRRARSPVFRDDYAARMCGPFWRTVVSNSVLSWIVVDRFLGRLSPVSPVIISRARYGEERAAQAVRNGVNQYVIIGAGCETFAMRRRDLMTRLHVWELDLPATQDLKHRRMRQAGLALPEGVTYVAVDLGAENLKDALDRSGFDAGCPALFSWFGVTYYLDEAAIRQTLATIARDMAPGSSVMFDYLAESGSTPAPYRELQKRCNDFVNKRGEPWITSFLPPAVPGYLRDLGFAVVGHLEPERIGTDFLGADAGIDYPPFFGFVSAASAA